jgi:hypothetical protein
MQTVSQLALKTVLDSKDRKMRRAFARQARKIAHGQGGMFSRFRSGLATGTTPHFKSWMAEKNMTHALRTARTSWVADNHPQGKVREAFGLVQTRFPSILDLAHATKRQILSVEGVGPASAKRIHAYLISNRVQPNWEV